MRKKQSKVLKTSKNTITASQKDRLEIGKELIRVASRHSSFPGFEVTSANPLVIQTERAALEFYNRFYGISVYPKFKLGPHVFLPFKFRCANAREFESVWITVNSVSENPFLSDTILTKVAHRWHEVLAVLVEQKSITLRLFQQIFSECSQPFLPFKGSEYRLHWIDIISSLAKLDAQSSAKTFNIRNKRHSSFLRAIYDFVTSQEETDEEKWIQETDIRGVYRKTQEKAQKASRSKGKKTNEQSLEENDSD
jgi:hypothetical protein